MPRTKSQDFKTYARDLEEFILAVSGAAVVVVVTRVCESSLGESLDLLSPPISIRSSPLRVEAAGVIAVFLSAFSIVLQPWSALKSCKGASLVAEESTFFRFLFDELLLLNCVSPDV